MQIVELPEQTLFPMSLQPRDYLDPLLLLTFELSPDRIQLARDVPGLGTFFMQVGGMLTGVYFLFLGISMGLASRFTWVNN